MSIALCRIDDRLIHGQVVVGWGTPLGVDRIVLVDEDVSRHEWEQQIYRMALPPRVAVEFAAPADAARRLAQWAESDETVFVLTGDVPTMVDLVRASDHRLTRINLGGIHAGTNRRELLRYLYLSDEELDALRGLEATGVSVTAQDLPTAAAVPLRNLDR